MISWHNNQTLHFEYKSLVAAWQHFLTCVTHPIAIAIPTHRFPWLVSRGARVILRFLQKNTEGIGFRNNLFTNILFRNILFRNKLFRHKLFITKLFLCWKWFNLQTQNVPLRCPDLTVVAEDPAEWATISNKKHDLLYSNRHGYGRYSVVCQRRRTVTCRSKQAEIFLLSEASFYHTEDGYNALSGLPSNNRWYQ